MKIRVALLEIGAVALAATVLLTLIVMSPEEKPGPKLNTEPNLFSFVKSMEGTRPDGEIKVAADDTLVVDAGLRRLFEYYLAAIGEKSLDEIKVEIEKELDRQLKPRAAFEAKRLLARFLDYKRDLVNVEKDPKVIGTRVEAIRNRMVAMQQARLRFFSDKEAQAMFGFDDAYDMDSVARLEISQDKSLSEARRKEKLAAVEAAMPAELRKERDAPMVVVKMEETVQKMRAQGASEDDIYRMRAATFTPEAAARLAEVDREDAAWKARIAAYLAERNKLAGSTQLSDAERQGALQRLRDAGFDTDEQKRLVAF